MFAPKFNNKNVNTNTVLLQMELEKSSVFDEKIVLHSFFLPARSAPSSPVSNSH
jgi:hypothetical protein